MWKLIYPKVRSRSDAWYYPSTMIDAGEIIEFVEDQYQVSDIKYWIICGDDMKNNKGRPIASEQQAKEFCEYLKLHVCAGNLKLRMKQKKP